MNRIFKTNLIVVEIIIKSLKSIGQFNMFILMKKLSVLDVWTNIKTNIQRDPNYRKALLFKKCK